jgi:hypothetical protein
VDAESNLNNRTIFQNLTLEIYKNNLITLRIKREEFYLGICIYTMGLVQALEIAWERSSVPVVAHKNNIFT